MINPPDRELFYSIHPEIFARFPGYRRGVVLAFEVDNRSTPGELAEMLREEEARLRDRLALETLPDHPRMKAWRDAFRLLGVKPSEYRPSIEALVRRVLRGEPLPIINALVDLGNLVSLRYLVPVGGHAIDQLSQDIALRPATGTEAFVALGSDTLEHPQPGEIIFVEGQVVLTRRWVWRQSRHTLTLPETRAVEINIDALPPVTPEEVTGICRDVEDLVHLFCGGRTRVEILSAQNPRISLLEK